MTAISGGRSIRIALVVALCGVIMGVENFDVTVIGLVAPNIMRDIHLTKAEFGLIAGVAMFGFFLGAPTGGTLGDRYGRRLLMVAGMILLGLGSMATPLARNVYEMVAIRFFVGFGAAVSFPNLIALAMAAMPANARAASTALTALGGASGGAIGGAAMAAFRDDLSWQQFFYVGGATPLLLAAFVWFAIPESRGTREANRVGGRPSELLFGSGRATATIGLWIANFMFTLVLMVLYAWLPTIVTERTNNPTLAAGVSSALFFGGAIGGLSFAVLLDRGARTRLFLVIYGCAILALLGMASVTSAWASLAMGAILGMFMFGGQVVLYAVPGLVYPAWGRSGGLGWATAMGRWGAILGPILAGFAYQSGMSGPSILVAATPFLAMGMLCFPLIFHSVAEAPLQPAHPEQIGRG